MAMQKLKLLKLLSLKTIITPVFDVRSKNGAFH